MPVTNHSAALTGIIVTDDSVFWAGRQQVEELTHRSSNGTGICIVFTYIDRDAREELKKR